MMPVEFGGSYHWHSCHCKSFGSIGLGKPFLVPGGLRTSFAQFHKVP